MPQQREIYTPLTGPPQTGLVPAAIFEAMGEALIFDMIASFYERLGRSEAAHLFPRGDDRLRASSLKTASLFVFLLGGPPLYQQRYGPPRMRQRHLPFVIDEAARAEWMRCIRETLAEAPARWSMPSEHVPALDDFLEQFSAWMVNTSSDPAQPGGA